VEDFGVVSASDDERPGFYVTGGVAPK